MSFFKRLYQFSGILFILAGTVHKAAAIASGFGLKANRDTTSADSAGLFLPGQAQLILVSDQFSFTEGPSVDKQGNIYFTDQPNNKIWKYDTQGKISLFKDNAGRPNGTYVDNNGNLIVCADEHNQLWQIDRKGKTKVLVNNLHGKRLNGPNDLWVSQHGDIYFTDPYYQRDYWARTKSELDGQKVYLLLKGSTIPQIIAADLQKPNGIAGTPDGKTLFVADIQANKIYKYTITSAGTLKEKQEFYNQGADGITLDEQGNLYLAGNGVTIVNPRGQKIAHINVPQPWTANLCFGGTKKNILFITASKAVYILPMKVKGVE
ncbi:SMP-30/gluconolactonase/LRE family protein [Mucilaginibacter sp.]